MYPINNADEHPGHVQEKFPGEGEELCVVHLASCTLQESFTGHPALLFMISIFFYFYREELPGALCSLQKELEGKILSGFSALWEGMVCRPP